MKIKKPLISFFCIFLGLAPILIGRELEAFISTDWLARNLNYPKLVILDIRSQSQYAKGHIPGALNAPMSLWITAKDGLTMELPSDESLRALLEKSGIDGSSNLLIANRTNTDFDRADSTRVAWTCFYAGLKNVSILDGGITKWTKENKSLSTENVIAKPTVYDGKIVTSIKVAKDYVRSRLAKTRIVDARTPEDYFGITGKEGHIKGAVNAPTPWLFTHEGTLIQKEILQSMANGVIGSDKSREVIVYCGVGGYASTWWFVLTQMFDYKNVKLYDGSIEEWIKDPAAPLSSYRWK
jgi:thiosulfate/3-mercaptopyruvate sulfurtransferase